MHKVLVVDDDKILQQSVKEALEYPVSPLHEA